MFKSEQLDKVAKALLSALPQSFHQVEEELQSKFKDILQATFARLDLVTREEFDVQVKVLAKTREKLEALEKKLEEK